MHARTDGRSWLGVDACMHAIFHTVHLPSISFETRIHSMNKKQ